MCSRIWWTLFILLVAVGAAGLPVAAQDMPRFEVLSTKVVQKLEGAQGGPIESNDTNIKVLVLLIKVTVTSDRMIWAPDLALSYTHAGSTKEDRSLCLGLSEPQSAPDAEGPWTLRNYANFTLRRGTSYFRAAFPLENDINEVALTYKRPVLASITVQR